MASCCVQFAGDGLIQGLSCGARPVAGGEVDLDGVAGRCINQQRRTDERTGLSSLADRHGHSCDAVVGVLVPATCCEVAGLGTSPQRSGGRLVAIRSEAHVLLAPRRQLRHSCHGGPLCKRLGEARDKCGTAMPLAKPSAPERGVNGASVGRRRAEHPEGEISPAATMCSQGGQQPTDQHGHAYDASHGARLGFQTRSRNDVPMVGTDLPFEDSRRLIPAGAGAWRRGLRRSIQISASDNGTLAPARLVAFAATGWCRTGRYRPSFESAMQAAAAVRQSRYFTFRGLAPSRPGSIHRPVKQQQTTATPTCAGDCR